MGRALGLLLAAQRPEDDEMPGTDDSQLALFASPGDDADPPPVPPTGRFPTMEERC